MMVCSILVQITNLVSLRRLVCWRGSMPFVIGGLLGLPPAVHLLLNANVSSFRLGFGVLLTTYSAYMLFRPLQKHSRGPCGP